MAIMALEVKRETFLQTPGNYFGDSQAAGCTSAKESAEEGTRLSRSHATDFPSLSNACSCLQSVFLAKQPFLLKHQDDKMKRCVRAPDKKNVYALAQYPANRVSFDLPIKERSKQLC